jgi:hypothetical protein
MMLEVNARPGLAIQIANQCGLDAAPAAHRGDVGAADGRR